MDSGNKLWNTTVTGSNLKECAVYGHIQWENPLFFPCIQFLKIQSHMLLCWVSNDTFRSIISFGCSKEGKARKMLQRHLLEEHSRNPVVLAPQQQLTVFLFAGRNIWVRTKCLSSNSLVTQPVKISSGTKCYHHKRKHKLSCKST